MTRSRKRKLKRAKSVFGTVPLASAILTCMPVAMAQQPAGGLEEIVVTAQKRTENLQDVPLSITALGTEQLENYNVDSFADYVKFLPSVSWTSFGPGFSPVYMRGVASGENNNHSGPLPSVGMYLDEQPITTITGALDLHIYDIARVEALAGPQGTLYGASSQAGTIRIITNKPDPSGFEAGYDLAGNIIDGGDAGGSVEGFANIPLTDNIAVRLVGWYQHDGGYIDNVLGARTYPSSGITRDNADRTESNFNPVNTYGGRAQLRVDLNENWSFTPTVMGQIQEADGIFSFDRDAGGMDLTHFTSDRTRDSWYQAALTVEGKMGNFDVVYAGSMLQRDVFEELDYNDYSYYYDVLYSYGFYFYDDAFNLIDPSMYIRGKDRFEKISHEIRLTSPQENRVRATAGAFVQRQQHDIEQRYIVDDLYTNFHVTGWNDTIWLTEQVRNDRDYALFGEVSFDALENVTLTGGVRYFDTRNSLKGFFGYSANFSSRTGEAVCFSPEQLNGGPCVNLDKKVEESGFVGKANATWRINDDAMVYFTWSEGFRPGGINRRGTLPPYGSDTLTSYEVGWKTAWLDNSLRFNGALFHSKWEDMQFSFLGANGLTEIQNAGEARINGFETSIDWVPTEQFTLSGGLSLIDAELTEDYIAAIGDPPAAPDGTSLPVTPDLKANVTGRYTFMISSFDAFVQGSLVYQSDTFSDLRLDDRAAHGELDSYAMVDFSAGIAKDNWHASVFLDNAFDSTAEVYRWDQCTVCGDATYVTPSQPRTFGLRFGQKF
jgi:outer membrane receptor protein involved in Fe transport